ncbi:MAG: XdhC family protein [Anaerolineae bacterium]|nr:XdhC family protein [Anaerolineae bacterium]
MREVMDAVEKWRLQGKQVGLATVVKVYGSAPRAMGAKMAVSEDGEIAGSVSGGCVEGAVTEEMLVSIKNKQARLLSFGIGDDLAWGVGLACGGQIEVFVEPLILTNEVSPAGSVYDYLLENIQHNQPTIRVTVMEGDLAGKTLLISGEQTRGDLGSEALNQAAKLYVTEHREEQKTQRFFVEVNQKKFDLFMEFYLPSERLIIIGAVHTAIPLVHFAKQLGFYTIVLDARSAFATRERFPHADEVQVTWPAEALEKLNINETTYIVTLSHDEKIDTPALKVAILSQARYVGALGSNKTHQKRVTVLREMGLPEEAIKRIHAPIGLNLGAVGPEEIALSIAAEMVQAHRNSLQLHAAG